MSMTISYEVGDKLYLNITNRCPCSCEFCIRNTGDNAYGSEPLWLEREPDTDEIIADLKRRELSKYSEIVFCGFGEPCERIDDMIAVCGYLKTVNAPEIRLNTNGLSDLINGRKTAHLLKGAVDTVSISLNTSSAEEYLKLCHPKFGIESFDAILTFAKDAKIYVPHVVFSLVDVILPHQVEECKKIAQSLSIPLRIRKYDS